MRRGGPQVQRGRLNVRGLAQRTEPAPQLSASSSRGRVGSGEHLLTPNDLLKPLLPLNEFPPLTLSAALQNPFSCHSHFINEETDT